MTFEKYQYVVNKDINIISIYDDVLVGKRRTFPYSTWRPVNGGFDTYRRCMRYLILEKLKLTRDQYKSSITVDFAQKYKLITGYKLLFNGSPSAMSDYVFPEWSIKPWEFNHSPMSYWNRETCILVIKWMIEDELKWSYEDVLANISWKPFHEYGIVKAFGVPFDYNLYDALVATYPDKDWTVVKLKNMEFGRLRQSIYEDSSTDLVIEDVISLSTRDGKSYHEIADNYGVNYNVIQRIMKKIDGKKDQLGNENEWFDLLNSYKNKFGNCLVSQNYKVNGKNLGVWVNTQRWNKKRGKMPEDKFKRLNDMGFVWSIRNKRDKEDKPNE